MLLLVSGLLHGRQSGRWGPTPGILAASESVRSASPEEIGSWRRESTHELTATEQKLLKCLSHSIQTYRNIDTDERVHVALLMGPPDRMAAHTPEVCYSRLAYELQTPRERRTISIGDDTSYFWRVNFEARTLDGGILTAYYAWGTGEGWRAPDDARFAFPGRRFLYKLQVSTTRLGDPLPEEAPDSFEDFLAAYTASIAASLPAM